MSPLFSSEEYPLSPFSLPLLHLSMNHLLMLWGSFPGEKVLAEDEQCSRRMCFSLRLSTVDIALANKISFLQI